MNNCRILCASINDWVWFLSRHVVAFFTGFRRFYFIISLPFPRSARDALYDFMLQIDIQIFLNLRFK